MYLPDVIPRRRYRLSIAITFIQALLAGTIVEKAWLHATGTPSSNPRHAWRWIEGFYQQLAQWRTLVSQSVETFVAPQSSKRLKVLLPTIILISGFFVFVAGLVFRAQMAKPRTGTKGLVGEIGIVKKALTPEGKVFVHGELWNAKAEKTIDEDTKVRVVNVVNLMLEVEPLDEHPAT